MNNQEFTGMLAGLKSVPGGGFKIVLMFEEQRVEIINGTSLTWGEFHDGRRMVWKVVANQVNGELVAIKCEKAPELRVNIVKTDRPKRIEYRLC